MKWQDLRIRTNRLHNWFLSKKPIRKKQTLLIIPECYVERLNHIRRSTMLEFYRNVNDFKSITCLTNNQYAKTNYFS